MGQPPHSLFGWASIAGRGAFWDSIAADLDSKVETAGAAAFGGDSFGLIIPRRDIVVGLDLPWRQPFQPEPLRILHGLFCGAIWGISPAGVGFPLALYLDRVPFADGILDVVRGVCPYSILIVVFVAIGAFAYTHSLFSSIHSGQNRFQMGLDRADGRDASIPVPLVVVEGMGGLRIGNQRLWEK